MPCPAPTMLRMFSRLTSWLKTVGLSPAATWAVRMSWISGAGSWLVSRKRSPLKVLPVDPRMRSERVVLRHRDHDALTPERHGFADHPVDLPGDDYDIDFLAFEAGDQPRS